jgi:replicative DNA helicase
MQSKNYTPIDLGKIPPQAVDLEEAVLGAIMLESDVFDSVCEILKPESFYKEQHQKIFKAFLSLSSKNESIDILTVTEELKKLKWLEDIGGPYFINQLTSKVASAAHIEIHACIIADKYVQRELIRISMEIQQKAHDDAVDIDELLSFAIDQFDSIASDFISSEQPTTIKESIKKSLSNLLERGKLAKLGKNIGIPTPLVELNKVLGGGIRSKYILIASRPGMGKTAVALSLMKSAAEADVPVALFSLEMLSPEITDRLIIGESDVDADEYNNGSLPDYCWQQLELKTAKLVDLPILIDDKPKSINKICLQIKRLHKQGKCGMAIIDYLQLAELDGKSFSREQEVSQISRAIKKLQQKLEIPIIVLSQLNRQVEIRGGSKRPQLSDLRESGSLEQDADIVAFLYRAAYYNILEDEEGNSTIGIAEIDIKKHRGGRLETIKFKHNKSLTAIYDIDTMYDSYQPTSYTKDISPNYQFESQKEINEPF